MKIKDAINRLRFTISKTNKPNQTDAEALNELLIYLSKVENETIQENLLFAKLYTFCLENLLHNYHDINFANKKINEILSEPMELRVNRFVMVLKQKELTNVVCDHSLESLNPNELKQKLAEYPEISKKYISLLDWWSKDTAIAYLNTNINLSFQNYKADV